MPCLNGHNSEQSSKDGVSNLIALHTLTYAWTTTSSPYILTVHCLLLTQHNPRLVQLIVQMRNDEGEIKYPQAVLRTL